jgi:hypothetical protein
MKYFFLFINVTACSIHVFKETALHAHAPLNDTMWLGLKMGQKHSLSCISVIMTSDDTEMTGKNICHLGKILWSVFRLWSSEMWHHSCRWISKYMALDTTVYLQTPETSFKSMPLGELPWMVGTRVHKASHLLSVSVCLGILL